MNIPWYSWLLLIAMLALGTLLVVFTHEPVVAALPRWIVTGIWALFTLALGLYDFVIEPDSEGIDEQPFDRWSISHGGAGVVFGIWFLPLVWTLLLVVAWEVFEALVPPFGTEETWWNRTVDVGIAVVPWLVVVLIVMAVESASFPVI